ncbi:glycosyltransferase family 2 protein [Herbiconiux sp. L3-i23]|uniref:glycosyltransferase family 2 protein n=1 Tax=Herbiconiux sp. L3-i23 TaxID=2905871 RepID=UPI0020649D4E|nr:glycosyltransferase family 2 protein [Herbiconiux sp. L3-i23]BDI23388.1 succinoglycan biosynthesis protein exoa [Herbiconiux sp. L3-i23]
MAEHAVNPARAGLPAVSYVMPVLNEADHIEAAVASLVGQDYEGPFDVMLALGPSTDGTSELVERMSAADPRIRSAVNELGTTPEGLNIAIRATSNPIVVRVDAHSVLPPDYTRIAVETLQRTGAANVGGVMDARGHTPFEQAVAIAYGSPVGLGGTRLHLGGEEGPAETVYLGVFQRDRLEAAGLFDEDIRRGQDWELNRRLRKAGDVVWFNPALRVVYRPRSSYRRLARQFLSTGLWRGELARREPSANGLRYFVPPVMVIGVALGILLGIAGIVQAAMGAVPWALIGFVAPAVYVLFDVAATVVFARGHGLRTALWFLLVLPCIHFCWGVGFFFGIAKLTRNIQAYTGR